MKNGTVFQISHHFYPTIKILFVYYLLVNVKMRLIATLVEDSKTAKRILDQIPNGSVILFPEAVSLVGATVRKYSIDKDLFIIYNSDTIENGKHYISMRGIDNGEEIWRVRKFNLWYSDKIDGFSSPSHSEPFVKINNHSCCLFICYDAVKIFKIYPELIKNRVEILLISANWSFNFELIKRIIDFAFAYVPTIKHCLFSNTNTFSLVKTRFNEKRCLREGWISILYEF